MIRHVHFKMRIKLICETCSKKKNKLLKRELLWSYSIHPQSYIIDCLTVYMVQNIATLYLATLSTLLQLSQHNMYAGVAGLKFSFHLLEPWLSINTTTPPVLLSYFQQFPICLEFTLTLMKTFISFYLLVFTDNINELVRWQLYFLVAFYAGQVLLLAHFLNCF